MLPRLITNNTNNGRQTEFGHLAGRVAVRTQGPRGLPQTADNIEWVSSGRRLYTIVPRQSNGQYEQLGQALGTFTVQATLNGPELYL